MVRSWQVCPFWKNPASVLTSTPSSWSHRMQPAVDSYGATLKKCSPTLLQ